MKVMPQNLLNRCKDSNLSLPGQNCFQFKINQSEIREQFYYSTVL